MAAYRDPILARSDARAWQWTSARCGAHACVMRPFDGVAQRATNTGRNSGGDRSQPCWEHMLRLPPVRVAAPAGVLRPRRRPARFFPMLLRGTSVLATVGLNISAAGAVRPVSSGGLLPEEAQQGQHWRQAPVLLPGRLSGAAALTGSPEELPNALVPARAGAPHAP